MVTHEVTNQVPRRVGIDEFSTNTALVEGVQLYDAGWRQAPSPTRSSRPGWARAGRRYTENSIRGRTPPSSSPGPESPERRARAQTGCGSSAVAPIAR